MTHGLSGDSGASCKTSAALATGDSSRSHAAALQACLAKLGWNGRDMLDFTLQQNPGFDR